jgi:glycosyltransferase involved in cell wall biosynthesis
MTDSTPTVSVVIATKNRRDLLKTCLRAVLAQVDVDLEVTVVDDGSTDGTSSMLLELREPRLRVLRNERSRGVGVARNQGASTSRGEWLAFTDDDDLWHPHKLRLQVEAGVAAQAVLVYCGAVIFGEDSRYVLPAVPVPSPTAFKQTILRGNPLPGGASAQMVHRDAFRRLDGFDEAFHHLADWDLWIRLASAGPAAAVDRELVAYRFHTENMVVASAKAHLVEFDRLIEKHADLSRREGVAFNPVGFNHGIANRQRLAGRRWRSAAMHLRAGLKYHNFGHLGCAVRTPLGQWAIGLRQPRVEPVACPDWLRASLNAD